MGGRFPHTPNVHTKAVRERLAWLEATLFCVEMITFKRFPKTGDWQTTPTIAIIPHGYMLIQIIPIEYVASD